MHFFEPVKGYKQYCTVENVTYLIRTLAKTNVSFTGTNAMLFGNSKTK